MSRLLDALHSGRVLLMDGAMGTELQRRGLREGECPEAWNLTHPEQVAAVHAAYLAAGAEVLVTNTFQANPVALDRHGLGERFADIWQAGIDVVRKSQTMEPLVLADFGPVADAPPSVVFRTRLEGVAADGLLLETWSALPADLFATALAVGDMDRTQPVLISYTFRHVDGADRFRTFADLTPEECARQAEALGAAALGANCGAEIDMDDLLEIVRRFRLVTDLPIFVRPNAGTPRRTEAGWIYPRSPQAMADKLLPLLEAGVTMVGGCCGTTPEHIAAFRVVVDQWNRQASLW